jgi:hypothetical protein
MTALMSGKLLHPATYAMMWASTPTPQYGAKPASDALRGLGWDTVVHTTAGHIVVSKSGQIPGYTSELILDLSDDSGVFVSFNTHYSGRHDPSAPTALEVAQSVYEATRPPSANRTSEADGRRQAGRS